MIPAVLDHLWQSTLLAAVVAILAMVFRNARASVRYGLWFTASVKFLVPFAALAALGRLLAPTFHPPALQDAVLFARAAQPFSQSDPTAVAAPAGAPLAHTAITSHAGALPGLTLVLLGVWALGFAIVLISWLARWARIRPLVGLATPVALAAPMPVLATPTMLEPGLVGLWRPVLLLPQALFDHLDRPGIAALVAHEACHYRRADNLTAAIHMLVEALFWFHPMVWWIGGRLVDERERACDEAVVRSGHDPAVYAASLLECCRLFLQSPLRCVAGASGSNLSRRVEMIMTLPFVSPLSRTAKAVLIAVGVCALASPVAAGWLTSPAERQVVSRAVALASSPASALVGEPPAAASTPEGTSADKTIIPVRTDAARGAPVRQFAALHLDPVRLDPGAGDQPPPELTKPLPLVAGAVPGVRLTPVADAESVAGQAPVSMGTPPKKICKMVRIRKPSPYVTQLCLTPWEWNQVLPQQGHSASDANTFDPLQPGRGTFPSLGPGDFYTQADPAVTAWIQSGPVVAGSP